MFFLYSDDRSRFKHNKIPHKMTYGLISVQGWMLNTGKNNSRLEDKRGTVTGWFLYELKKRDFVNWPLNTGRYIQV